MQFLLELHTRGGLLFQSIYGKLVNQQGFHMCHLPDYFNQLFHYRHSLLEVRIFDALRMSDLHHNYLMTYAKKQSSQFINYSITNSLRIGSS